MQFQLTIGIKRFKYLCPKFAINQHDSGYTLKLYINHQKKE